MRSAAALKDFFGIKHLTNKDIAGSLVKSKLPTDKISTKFSLLSISRDTLENKEVIHDVKYGQARFDSDNKPQGHGQFDTRNTKALFDSVEIKKRYSPPDAVTTNSPITAEVSQSQSDNQPPQPEYGPTIKISDVRPERDLSEILALFRTDDTKNLERYMNRPPCTFFFEAPSMEPKETPSDEVEKLSGGKIEDLAEVLLEASTARPTKSALIYDPRDDTIPLEDQTAEEDQYPKVEDQFKLFDVPKDDFKFDREIEEQYSPKNSHIEPKNALEYLKDIRSGKTKPTNKRLQSKIEDEDAYSLKPRLLLDSRGFNDYSRQTPDWDNCRRVDILKYIKRSIVYHNYDVLAINKPYGIASHEESKRVKIDMNLLVQELAESMGIKKVYLAHRLDKTTTGVLLFATSQKQADHLNKLFKSDQIKKTYWCITKGIPDPEEAIIDIPIGESSIAGKMRSCLAPEKIEKHRQLTQRYRMARRAVTEYAVIQSHKQVSLVEAKPRSGVKHQIRCHLGFGLGNPILGDHKYSHLGKFAPQELSVPVLNALHLRQTKVRTLPIHLHAKTVVIPAIKPNGENLFIHAPLPPHFKDNLMRLGLLSRDVIQSL